MYQNEISILNPAYSKDSSDEADRKIMIPYKITKSTINNKTKFQYDLHVNKIQEDMITTLEGSSFWDIGRIFNVSNISNHKHKNIVYKNICTTNFINIYMIKLIFKGNNYYENHN